MTPMTIGALQQILSGALSAGLVSTSQVLLQVGGSAAAANAILPMDSSTYEVQLGETQYGGEAPVVEAPPSLIINLGN